MLSSAQRDQFDRRRILRLPATIPPAEVTAMCQRLWQHLLDTHAIHPNGPETWTVHTPAQFQKLTGTGAFDAMATGQLRAAIDDLLGAGRWQRPAQWGRPLVTFPPRHGLGCPHQRLAPRFAGPGADHAGGLRPPRARTAPRWRHAGGHRLTTPSGPQAGNAPVRSREVKAHLSTVHPWLRDLWKGDGDTDRIHRYLTAGADIDGVYVQVEELTGEPGDAVIMHPRLLHVVAPAASTRRG